MKWESEVVVVRMTMTFTARYREGVGTEWLDGVAVGGGMNVCTVWSVDNLVLALYVYGIGD